MLCKLARRFSSLAVEPSRGSVVLKPNSLFRRELPVPPALASFASPKGQELFQTALVAGTMKCFFQLAQHFTTQDEPAYCGISTLTMILNTFGVDPERNWKGIWRWYHEEMLSCCSPLEEIKENGINIDEFRHLAECNGARIVKYVTGGGDLNEFRGTIKTSSMSSSETRALVVSYSRKEFEQTGDGHFSPIGGYCETEDAVLILDVARFKYPAHWVKVETLWKAMQRLDPSTGNPRGYMVLEPSRISTSVLFTIRTHFQDWKIFSDFFETLGSATHKKGSCCSNPLALEGNNQHERSVNCFFQMMPIEVSNALATYEDAFSYGHLPYRPRDHELAMETLQKEVELLEVYQIVKTVLAKIGKPNQNVFLSSVLFLAFPQPEKFICAFEKHNMLQDILHCSPLLQNEIQLLTRQIVIMMESSKETTDCKKCSRKKY